MPSVSLVLGAGGARGYAHIGGDKPTGFTRLRYCFNFRKFYGCPGRWHLCRWRLAGLQ